MKTPAKIRLGLAAYLAGLFVLSFFGFIPSGCTGKSITLYNPSTGQKLATYSNTTDSDIGGLELEYDPATNLFRIKVKSSSQSASDSNAAMWAAVEKLVDKIPVPIQ